MSKYLKHTISLTELKKIVQDNLKLKFTYVKNDSKRKLAVRNIASQIITDFDSDNTFNNINNDHLQIITADDWLKIEGKNENTINKDIYDLLYTDSNLDDDILKQLYDESNNKIVDHTDIIDLIVRFLKHTTEDDIL